MINIEHYIGIIALAILYYRLGPYGRHQLMKAMVGISYLTASICGVMLYMMATKECAAGCHLLDGTMQHSVVLIIMSKALGLIAQFMILPETRANLKTYKELTIG